MTRETKIGLLVGLAFIIVIGILLSDYNRIENPQAQLFVAGPNVQAGVSSPRSDAPTQTTIVYPSLLVSPRQPVPTKAELSQRGVGSAVVVVHENGQFNGRPTPEDQGQQNIVVVHGHKGTDLNPIQSNDGQQDLKTIVKVHNEELVPVSPNGGQSGNKNGAPQAGKQYTAEAGDTVSKMAGRFMGGNSKTNRDAIVKANPSLQANINNVVAGKVYVIPSAVAASGQPAPPAAKQPVAQAPVNQPPQVPTHWYVVKESDSLWRIAQDQVGDPNAVAVIKELNKDVLKGRDELHPNMRLRLPAKPLASAN